MLSQVLHNYIVMFLWHWPQLEGGSCSLPTLCDQMPLSIWSCLLAALQHGHFSTPCDAAPFWVPVLPGGSCWLPEVPANRVIFSLQFKTFCPGTQVQTDVIDCSEALALQSCQEQSRRRVSCSSASLQCWQSWCPGKVRAWPAGTRPWHWPWGSRATRTLRGAFAGTVLLTAGWARSWSVQLVLLGLKVASAALRVRFGASISQPRYVSPFRALKALS